MQCVMLGTGGYHPNEIRHTAGILLPEQGILLDAGTSLFRLAERLQSSDLQVFLTHPHWDHIIGLTFLLVPMIDGRIQRCRVYGDENTLNCVKNLLFAHATFPVLPNFEFVLLEEGFGRVAIRGGELRHQRLKSHPGGSRAYRLDVGTTALSYITDTTADRSYDDFVRNSNLLIHECYFDDGREELARQTGHSCLSTVVQTARETDCQRLLLTHIDPLRPTAAPFDISHVRRSFANIDFASDQQIVTV